MNNGHESRRDNEDGEFFQRIHTLVSENRWMWQAVGTVFGLAGGLVTILIGSVFTVASWFSQPGKPYLYLYRLGTVPFFFTIPLLIFGACCLDLLEKRCATAPPSRSRLGIPPRNGDNFT